MIQFVFVFILTIFLISCGNYREVTSPVFPNENKGQSIQSRLDFSQIKEEILVPHCISCHKGRHNLYDNYQIVKTSAFQMLERMESTNPTLRMPEDLPALPDETIAKFKEWVLAGAPEFNDQEIEEPTEALPTLSFTDVKERVLDPYKCTTCHSHYNDFATVKKSLASIVQFIDENKMPFPQKKGEEIKPVLDADKSFLARWVEQGSPEYSDGTTTSELNPPLKPTYISIRNQILGPKCTLCHNSYGGRGPKNFDSFFELQKIANNSPLFFDHENPNDSLFIGAILGRFSQLFFDPMPFNNDNDDIEGIVPPVTDEELKTIEKWIELKLPYNESEL